MAVTKIDVTRQGRFSGDVDLQGVKLTNAASGTSSGDLVTKSQLDAATSGADAVLYKGVIDASGNPNYPAADAGHLYKISVAGKIGGASGPNVEIGDTILCTADGTASGTHAAVGANWDIIQVNIDGAVTGPTSAVADQFATFNGTTGKVIKDSGLSLDTDTGLAANSDTKIPSQKAVKAYVDSVGAVPDFATREAPTGAINGVNTTFTLANTPTAGSEEVYLNGILQEPGAGNDYTISGATITYLTAPLTGDRLRVSYRY
jgi:hypothetical protein